MNLYYFLMLVMPICSVIAYFVMLHDKNQAIKKKQRISENTLFLLALCFGALGIYLGMKAPLFHKAAKLKFKILVPICIVLNVGCIILLYLKFHA